MEQHPRRALGDVVSGAVMLAITAAGWMSLRANKTLATFDFGTDPGPALMPRLLLWGLGAGGLVLAVRGTWRLVRAGGLRGGLAMRSWAPPLLLPALFVASLAVYVRSLTFAGFRLATLLFCAAWIFVLIRPGRRLAARDALFFAGAATLITGAIYYVFKGVIHVPLP